MLAPKKVKWRKQHDRSVKGVASRGTRLNFGDYGLQVERGGKITARQIEAARVAMTRSIKRGGDVWIRIFPDLPLTRKAAETRMGSGKGNVEEWCASVKKKRILFEMGGVPEEEAFKALILARHKLPLPCKLTSKKIEAQEKLGVRK